MTAPAQNVVTLKDGRVLTGVALDGASPCLSSYSFAKGLSDEERARLFGVQPRTEIETYRDAMNRMLTKGNES